MPPVPTAITKAPVVAVPARATALSTGAAIIPLLTAVALSAATSLTVAGCAQKRDVKSQRLPDGSVRITCQTSLQVCLDSADLICKGRTYDVLHARDQRDQFGAELGTSQVEVRASEAVIRCANTPAPDDTDALLASPVTAGPQPPAATPPTTPSTTPQSPSASLSAPQPPLPPPPRACVPGATQACVGPGACEGGQSCLPTGAGFGPCDCGTMGPPVTTKPAGETAPGEKPLPTATSPKKPAPPPVQPSPSAVQPSRP